MVAHTLIARLASAGAAAACAATGAFAQELTSSVPGVAGQVEEIQAARGMTSPELIGPLTSLGLVLREQEDLTLAAAAFERARHIVRVNFGLSSFEEAPLLRQLIQIEEAKGNAGAAWDLEQKLLGLIHRHPGPRAAPLLEEIADKRTDVLRRYSAGEMPPQIMLGCYYAEPVRHGPQGCPGSGSSRHVKIRLLDEARSYYMDTIAMVVQSKGLSAAELPALYLAWVRAIYTFPNDDITHYEGREILRDIHSLAARNSEPLAARMNAWLQVADWDLRFAGGREENEAAFRAYEALYAQLVRAGVDAAMIDEIFAPGLPVVVPAFAPNPLASSETPNASRYLDVAFEITKHGEGKSIEFLDTSSSTADAARLRLRDIVKRSRFRPRMADGAFADPARVVVRYYVSD